MFKHAIVDPSVARFRQRVVPFEGVDLVDRSEIVVRLQQDVDEGLRHERRRRRR